MIAIFNRLPVNKGAAGQIAERFANSRGNVQGFPRLRLYGGAALRGSPRRGG